MSLCFLETLNLDKRKEGTEKKLKILNVQQQLNWKSAINSATSQNIIQKHHRKRFYIDLSRREQIKME